MNLESYYIKANHDWKWTDFCDEKYSNLYEFISNVSEDYRINVTGEVYIESITDIHLDEKVIQVTGEASLSVSLQYGSDREQEEDDEDMEMTFPMDYTVTLNWNREIVDLEYEIDTDGFYE